MADLFVYYAEIKKCRGRIIAIPLTGCYTRSTNTVSDELPWEFILCFSKEYEMLTEKMKRGQMYERTQSNKTRTTDQHHGAGHVSGHAGGHYVRVVHRHGQDQCQYDHGR